MAKHTHRGTCQICGALQAVNAKTGLLAAHGYTVPAHWHQRTASCFGARKLPFQVSRDVIPALMDSLRQQSAHLRAAAEDMRANGTTFEVELRWPSRASIRKTEAGFELIRASLTSFRPATTQPLDAFLAQQSPNQSAEERAERARGMYAEAVASAIHRLESDAASCLAELPSWQARYDGWKPAPLIEAAP